MRGSKSNSTGSNNGSRGSTLVRGVSEMPTLGPESLDLIFRLGCLTTAQLRVLLPARRSLSQVQRVTKALRSGRLLESARRPYPYGRHDHVSRGTHATPAAGTEDSPFPQRSAAGPMAAGSLGPATSAGALVDTSTARWANIHYLTASGLSLVARTRDLYPSVAKSLYDRVLDEARVYHALLRNEFYAWLVEDLSTARSAGSSSRLIETLCAESGYTPMRLADGKRSKARYLNPDGVLEFGDESDPSFYERVLIESDTGSQDMPWQISAKAEKFAEYVVKQLDRRSPAEQRSFRAPKVCFISPGVARSRWVRETFVDNAQRSDSMFREARVMLRERSADSADLASAVLFTNFSWLAKRTPLGKAYWPLAANELASLTG